MLKEDDKMVKMILVWLQLQQKHSKHRLIQVAMTVQMMVVSVYILIKD
jgi:hypothetical protein